MRPYVLSLHERPVTMVKFNYDGDLFLTCGKDGEVNLVRTSNCERLGTFSTGEKSAVYAVDITLDSQRIVTADAAGKIIFYALDGRVLNQINQGGICKYVEWNTKPGPAQNMVVSCNDRFNSKTDGNLPNRIMVWQADPPKRLLSIDENLPMKATKVKWGPFDEVLIGIFEEGTVIGWCPHDGKQLWLKQAHQQAVTSLSFNEDRTLMITSSKDQTAKLWAMDEIECIKTYKTDRPLNDVAISPLFNSEENGKFHILMGGGQDAKDVTTTGSSSGKFESLLWHLIYEEEIGTCKGHFGPMNTLAWFRQGDGFVTGGEDGYVRVHHFDNDYFSAKPFE